MKKNGKSNVGKYWIATVKDSEWTPPSTLPKGVAYLKGQLEEGGTTGFRHWQFVIGMVGNTRLSGIKKTFPVTGHYELTRSSAANEYVCKDETSVPGSRFELGKLTFRRNEPKDWERIRELAIKGDYKDIPSDIFVRCYNQLRRISSDNLSGIAMEREILVYWGLTGTGKSKTAWEEAGLEAYPKIPTTKFWDGYQGQEHVIIDEFRGGIDISHVLRWFDRYPVLVEVKGSATVLKAKKIWVTSNLHPELWYPGLDTETKEALLRRLTIKSF